MKTKTIFSTLMMVIVLFPSCGTICGGRIDHCQRIKGDSGTPKRSLRPAAMIFDLLPCLSGYGVVLSAIYLVVDFSDNAIYRPCSYYSPNTNTQSQAQQGDVIYLKNGSIVHGTIIEQVPGKSIKIQTKDGNVFVYTMDEIDKITKEGGK